MFHLLILPAAFAEPSLISAAINLVNKVVGKKDNLDNMRVIFITGTGKEDKIRALGFKMSKVSDELKTVLESERYGFDKNKGTAHFLRI